MPQSVSAIIQVTTSALGVAPGPVNGLIVTALTSTSVALAWSAPATGTTPFTYQVQQNGVNVGLPTQSTNATITGLVPATTYQFQVLVSNSTGNNFSNTLPVTTPAILPGAPIGLAVSGTPTQTSVALQWAAPAQGTPPLTYGVFFRTPPGGGSFTTGPTSSTTSATVVGLAAGTQYDFEVSATNSAGTGPVSAILTVQTATTGAVLPSAPTNLTAVPSSNSVQVSWPASTGTQPINYTLQWRPSTLTVPAPAAAVGFNTLTFGPSMTLSADPTIALTGNWQPFNFFGNAWKNVNVTSNADGSLTIGTNQPGGFGNQLSSAAFRQSPSPYFAGIAFGGGMYAEAVMSFPYNTTTGGPAFWANDVESMAAGSAGDVSLRQWPGQLAGYGDWIENDFTEFDAGNTGRLQFSLHNFYGPGSWFGGIGIPSANFVINNAGQTYKSRGACQASTAQNAPGPTGTGSGIVDGTCVWDWVSAQQGGEISTVGSGSSVAPPAGTNFNSQHSYGMLWVPATATTSGFVKWYFDRVQIGNTITWNQYNSGLAPPPVDTGTGGSSAYSVMDTRHMALILGNAASVSGQNPGSVTVYSAVVWQASSASNIVR